MRAHKAHSLVSQVYEPRNLQRAWEQVGRTMGAQASMA
jgi:hypothetical protein